MKYNNNRILIYTLLGAVLLLVVLYSPIGSPYIYNLDSPYELTSTVNFGQRIPNVSGTNRDFSDVNSGIFLPSVSVGQNLTKKSPMSSGHGSNANSGTSSPVVSISNSSRQINVHQTSDSRFSSLGGGASMSNGSSGNGGGGSRQIASNQPSSNFSSVSSPFPLGANKTKKNSNLSNENFLNQSDVVTPESQLLDETGPQKGGGLPVEPDPDTAIPVSDGFWTLVFFAFAFGLKRKFFLHKRSVA